MSNVFIIAEAGVNHNGRFENACKLVDMAVEAGVDAVKFQTFISENCISRKAEKANYQKATTGTEENQFEMVKKLELSFEEFRVLKKYCDQKHIMFLSTAFDLQSAEFLNEIGVSVFKIPSGEITNYPLLKKIGQYKKKVIMSTGMCNIREIEDAIKVIREQGTTDITILHCNTQYPTPMEDVNLNAMLQLGDIFGYPVGYSDHTMGIEVPIAAVALGATVIEKHITLDRTMEGPDQKVSLEKEELKKMVECIHNIEKAMGRKEKGITDSERENLSVARKSIVAAKNIAKGEVYTEENLAVKRPGTGISPMRWNEILGNVANKDYETDEMIQI